MQGLGGPQGASGPSCNPIAVLLSSEEPWKVLGYTEWQQDGDRGAAGTTTHAASCGPALAAHTMATLIMATLTMAIRTVGADEHVHFATVLVVDAAVLPGGPAATLFLQLRQVDSPNPNPSGTLSLFLQLRQVDSPNPNASGTLTLALTLTLTPALTLTLALTSWTAPTGTRTRLTVANPSPNPHQVDSPYWDAHEA